MAPTKLLWSYQQGRDCLAARRRCEDQSPRFPTISQVTGSSSGQEGAKTKPTRERLLDATAQVLASRGFAGTRLADIGDVANVQGPAIYYYYSSREDLIEEVMFVGASAMLDHLSTVLDSLPTDTSATDRLMAAVDAHLRLELEISDYSRAIIRNANQLPANVSKRALALVTKYNATWKGLIADVATTQQTRPDVDPGIARMLILGSLNWAAEWFDEGVKPLDDVIKTAQAMVLHTLIPDAS